MLSSLFSDRHAIEDAIFALLRAEPYFLSSSTASSPRAAGDAIQGILSEKILSVFGPNITGYTPTFARRAMADIAFDDPEGHYVIDVKTHRLKTAFNMPNLISVERLTSFYEKNDNHFVLLLVNYDSAPGVLTFESVQFISIEFLSWDCLTIGALGWGQIQIVNANKITILETSRREWMLQLCEVMLSFYPREISKIATRVARFELEKERWQAKS
jgi:hypothetical protein